MWGLCFSLPISSSDHRGTDAAGHGKGLHRHASCVLLHTSSQTTTLRACMQGIMQAFSLWSVRAGMLAAITRPNWKSISVKRPSASGWSPGKLALAACCKAHRSSERS